MAVCASAAFFAGLVAFSTPYRAETLLVAAHNSSNVVRFDATGGTFVDVLVAQGVGGLATPHDMALGADGALYVILHFGGRVLKFDARTGASLGDFIVPGDAGLDHSHGATFGPDGNLYILDVGNNRVVSYSGSTGAFIGTLLTWPFQNPDRITFGPDGGLYVGDFGASEGPSVLRFDGVTGAPFPAPGKSGATFAEGLGAVSPVLFGSDGLLYVGLYNGGSVLRYDTAGTLVDTFVAAGSGGIQTAQDFAFNAVGELYLADAAGDRVYHYDHTGAFVEALAAPDPATMMLPIGLVFLEECGDCQGDDRGKVTLCHAPPGNPNRAHTIRVGQAAVPAHCQHGDTCGPCSPTAPGGKGKGNGHRHSRKDH